MAKSYVKPKHFSLKSHPEYSEKWVQSIIADDPSILGLGDLILRDQERIQPRAGRLDLLLQDVDTKRRYEVELQLGSTDEAHIIRTIEYWDIERKRYPQYDHCAVIIAEKITSRFLNVISLFNGTMPLVAIQMHAIELGDHISLVFNTVLSEFSLGLVDEDEDAEAAPTDRAYWEGRATKQTLKLVDKLFKQVREFDQALELKYNKFYIGLSKQGQPFNFVTFRPKKKHMNLELKLPQTDEFDTRIEDADFDTNEYSVRYDAYMLRLTDQQIEQNLDLLTEWMKESYDRRST